MMKALRIAAMLIVCALQVSCGGSDDGLDQTGDPLDIAVDGDGFFAVVTADGTLLYARSATLQINSDWSLATNRGILSAAIAVPPDAAGLTIGTDGVVSLLRSSTTPAVIGQIEAWRFVNPDGLVPVGEGYYQESAEAGEGILGTFGDEGFGVLKQGYR